MYNKLRHLLFLLFLLLLSSCSDSEEKILPAEKKEFTLPVQLGKVIYKSVSDEIRVLGNIETEQRLVINAEVSGRIVRMLVKEGWKVKTGQLLAQIDSREFELELKRLRAELLSVQKEYEKAKKGLRDEDKHRLQAKVSSAESTLNLAQIELRRTQRMVNEKVLSLSALDRSLDNLRQAEEFLNASKAELEAGKTGRSEDIEKLKSDMQVIKVQVEEAKLSLSKTNIVAPFDGIITWREADLGTYVQEGTQMLRMIGTSGLKAVLEIPQGYINKLPKIKKVELLVRELDLKLKYNKNLAKLVRVVPDANIFSGNIKVQMDLPNPSATLFAGLTLEGIFNFGIRRNVLHVPTSSLLVTKNGTVVYVVKDEKAHVVPVRSFKEKKGLVEIKDITRQLGPKVDLIMRGSGTVFEGVKVVVTNPVQPKDSNKPESQLGKS